MVDRVLQRLWRRDLLLTCGFGWTRPATLRHHSGISHSREPLMRDPIRRAFCVLAGAACLAVTALAAEPPVSAADGRDLRAVIEAQLAAFRSDNAEQAFSYASPSIREMFVTADYFMAMVRGSYPVVYRPESVAFLLPEIVDGAVIQRVRMTDQQGDAWLAIYRMQRQADRSWRIDGCVVTRDNGRTA
jgi:Domain of unknown function (DUF4864)